MKKVFLAVALIAATSAVNAQLFLGGSIGLNGTSGSTKVGENDKVSTQSAFDFSLNPTIGYNLTDKWIVGGTVAFGIGTTNDHANPVEVKTTAANWSINPFARYEVAKFNKFGVWVEGKLTVGGVASKDKTTTTIGTSTTVTTVKDPYTTILGINFTPMMTYNISDNWQLTTALNFLGVGFNSAIATQTVNDVKTVGVVNSYGLNLNTDNVFGTLGGITIGAVYYF